MPLNREQRRQLRIRLRSIKCPECGAEVGEDCRHTKTRNETGRAPVRKGQLMRSVHEIRRLTIDKYDYCANESQSGYPCGDVNCPHCGGSE